MKTFASLIVALSLLRAGPALAASPLMSNAPGSTPACGVPGLDVCFPPFDVLTNFPAAGPVPIPGPAALGLVPGDVINSFSWGVDAPVAAGATIRFSVSPASGGIAGAPPDVFSEAGAGEAPADIYDGGVVGAVLPNSLLVDGDGLPAAAPPASGLSEPGDNLTALGTCNPPSMFGAPVVFTLAPGSPTLIGLGAGPADILISPFGLGVAPGVLVPAAVLGLVGGDVIDALAMSLGGPPLVISLAPGSPSIGAGSPADLFTAAPFGAFVPAAALGLKALDDVDAVDIGPDGDADLVNDVCDNCPGLPNNDQADGDADGVGDVCDPCPNVAGGAPVAMTASKALLVYKASGPGSSDDIPKLIRADFSTATPFDPDSTDDVTVTLRNTTTGKTLYEGSATTASGLWTQAGSGAEKWTYTDTDTTLPPGTDVKKAKLQELSPPGSDSYRFKLIGRGANITNAPIAPATDDVEAIIEITPAGVCAAVTLTTCSSTASRDKCLP
jgi:hypothetical protein